MGNNHLELCHFCEHPWVLQFVQGLLQGKIEGDISDKEVEVMVIHINFQWGLWTGIYFPGKLCFADAFGFHFIQNTIINSVVEVGTINGSVIV